MFAVTFLGTSATVPSAERSQPSVRVEAGHRVMVDFGEGAQRQLLRSGAGFRRLDRLLLTHGHFDHVLGIPGLFSTLQLRQSSDLMSIHDGTAPSTLSRACSQAFGAKIVRPFDSNSLGCPKDGPDHRSGISD